MATVALQVLHSNKDLPLQPTQASLQPPPLAWSSSPLASANSNTPSTTDNVNGLPSSGSKSDSSSGTEELLLTRRDIISNASAAIANINRKRRVAWDLSHRKSCSSSPKHRFHPYHSSYTAKASSEVQVNDLNATVNIAGTSDCEVSSSSSPSRRTATRHRRSASRSSSFKPPRSILKCLRSAKVAQYNLTHSSPGKRALLASPGGRTFFHASPSASPRRRSASTFFASCRSPGGRSPGRSPRGVLPSLSFGAIGSKSPSLAEITRANGGGRKHTVSFPDLRAPKSTEVGAASPNGAMMMSMHVSTGSPSAQATNGKPVPAASSSSVPPSMDTNTAASNATGNVGLGLGQPFEGKTVAEGEGTRTQADPRMQIISACHTLKYSLASPVWEDAATRNASSAQPEEDCFDSQPFDFPPRNLEQIQLEQSSSSPSSSRQIPFPSVHLRELEAAYATIIQYAQIYIQTWYNVATPESASTSTSAHVSSPSEEDDLDREFAKLLPLVLKSVSRDIYRALHPVPTQNVSTIPEDASVTRDKASPTIEQTREARQALLHRSGLSNGDASEEPASSSPLAFPSDSPDPSTTKMGTLPEKPKRIGRSTAEMRRRRNEINVVEAALQAFGTLATCERFWRYFEEEQLQSTVRAAAEIPLSSLFRGPKHRDLLSSFNWIIANQTLTTPAYMVNENTRHPLKSVLDHILEAIMSSIEASTKNGEKARRVLSEAFRAIRTLVLAYPSAIVTRLINEPYNGKIALAAKYLCSPTKALRENAALLLAAIGFALTANWDDRSQQGQESKLKAHDAVSMELFKHWTLSPDQIGIDDLSRHLDVALGTKTASDYHYVRLVVNTLPIVLGKRFRKMERKGPHMWLSKAIELKKREDFGNGIPTYATALHVLTFLHVSYAWASSSREVASKHVQLLEHARRKGEDFLRQADGQKLEEGFWGLGDKALRVVAQNIEAVTAEPWSKERYQDQGVALEIDATVALVLSFTYAFTGLTYTIWPNENPTLHRDLSKLFDTFINKHLPHVCKASIPSVRTKGWKTMTALLRAGEEVPSEDTALKTWSLDRVVNWRMLGVFASQGGQPLWPVSLVISESVTPQEIPSFDGAWVYDKRASIAATLSDAYKALIPQLTSEGQALNDASDTEDWIKNEDGHSIMPASVSNCIRTFFNTLRAACGQEDSNTEPTESTLELVQELSQTILSIVDEFWPMCAETSTQESPLSLSGIGYSTLLHFTSLLEQTFGTLCLQTRTKEINGTAIAAVIALHALKIDNPAETDVQARSAYMSLIGYVCKVTAPSTLLLQAVSTKLSNLVGSDNNSNQLAISLWDKVVQWLASHSQDAVKLESVAVLQVLGYAPLFYQGVKPSDEVQRSYAIVLATASSASPNQAWANVQQIAEDARNRARDPEAYLAWAALPLMRGVSAVDEESFIPHIIKTAAIAESAPQSPVWSIFEVASALATGLSKCTDDGAIRVLPQLRNTIVSMCKSSTLPVDSRMRLYEGAMEAFERAYQQDPAFMTLKAVSDIFVACPFDRLGAFVGVWNETYGTSMESHEYSDALKGCLQAAIQQGFDVRLPAWIDLPRPASTTAEQASADMAVDNEGVTVVQDSYTSEDVPETQSGDQEPQAEVSSMERIQSATSATAEEAIPRVEETDAGPEPSPATTAAQLDSQKSSAIEETPLQTDSSTANNAVSTQVPPLSQIPDIPDVSVARAAIDNASEMVESMEDSITSIVPETQIPIVQESDTTTGDASATGIVPETQVPAHTVEKQEADRQERAGSTDSELSELSEIEETQIIDDNTSAEAGALVQEEIFRAPSPALERVPGQIGIDNVIFANAAGPSKELERLRVLGPKAMLPASLPSPDSSITSSKAEPSKAPARKRQTVEVVIPFRPWIPRYPSTARSGDEDSQRSARSGAAPQSNPDASAPRPQLPTRKHSLESMDDTSSEGSVRRKKPRHSRANAAVRESEKMIASSKALLGPRPVSRKDKLTKSRSLKATTSLPTVIHSKLVFATTRVDSDDDESISSSEEEIHVASSPNVAKRIKHVSDSVELSRKQQKRWRSDSLEEYQARKAGDRSSPSTANGGKASPATSSPSNAASQRVRRNSHSKSVWEASSSGAAAPRHGGDSKRVQKASGSSRATSSTSRTGRDLARILANGNDSDIEEVLMDLSARQMQKLHYQIENRLKQVYGVKPVKGKGSKMKHG